MSKIFYDKLLILDEVERLIKKHTTSQEEKEELWKLVDEIIHHRMMGCILDNLPPNYHQEFLDKYSAGPHDESILDWLGDKIQNLIETLSHEIKSITKELLRDIK